MPIEISDKVNLENEHLENNSEINNNFSDDK